MRIIGANPLSCRAVDTAAPARYEAWLPSPLVATTVKLTAGSAIGISL